MGLHLFVTFAFCPSPPPQSNPLATLFLCVHESVCFVYLSIFENPHISKMIHYLFFSDPFHLVWYPLETNPLLFLKILFIFRERGREGEKHQRVVASCVPRTGDLAHNPGMRSGWESNQRPFGSQAGAQSTEPHQPRLNPFLYPFIYWWTPRVLSYHSHYKRCCNERTVAYIS